MSEGPAASIDAHVIEAVGEGVDGDKRFRVVAIVAAVLFAPQVLAHVFVPLTVVPSFKQMFADMGGQLPGPTMVLVSLGPWLVPILLALDAAVFWLCYKLARRYWIGLLFAPLFAGGLILGPVITMLYLPMTQIITLVE